MKRFLRFCFFINLWLFLHLHLIAEHSRRHIAFQCRSMSLGFSVYWRWERRERLLMVMGRRSGLRARCRHRCGTWWITCKCHQSAVDTCRTCAAVCRNSRRTLTICCTKTYLVALNFIFLVRSLSYINCSHTHTHTHTHTHKYLTNGISFFSNLVNANRNTEYWFPQRVKILFFASSNNCTCSCDIHRTLSTLGAFPWFSWVSSLLFRHCLLSRIAEAAYTQAAQKSIPLKILGVFSAMASHFIIRFCTFIKAS